MSRNSHWTEAELLRLRKLARSGMYTTADLAQLTGRSVGNLRLKLAQLGLEAKPAPRALKVVPDDKLRLLSDMAEKGFSVTAMRQKTHLSEEVVRRSLVQILGKPYRQPVAAVREKRTATIRAHLAEVPKNVKNDHLKHCLAVLRASAGRGFPFGLSTGGGRIGGQDRAESGCHIEPLREQRRISA